MIEIKDLKTEKEKTNFNVSGEFLWKFANKNGFDWWQIYSTDNVESIASLCGEETHKNMINFLFLSPADSKSSLFFSSNRAKNITFNFPRALFEMILIEWNKKSIEHLIDVFKSLMKWMNLRKNSTKNTFPFKQQKITKVNSRLLRATGW